MMQQQIWVNDEEIMVDIIALRHGFRVDAFSKIGGRSQFFRSRGRSVSDAIGNLRVGIYKADQAAVARRRWAQEGLRVVP